MEAWVGGFVISPILKKDVHFLFQNCHFHPLSRFTSLQILPTEVVDFTHLQTSSTCTCLVLLLVLSVFAYTSFPPTASFHPLRHRNQFSPSDSSMKDNFRKLARLVGLHPKKGENKNQRHVKIKKAETSKSIFTHHFSPTTFTDIRSHTR